MNSYAPKVVIISAPSGTGKTSLNRKLVETHPDHLAISVSYTTRPKRPHEVDGDHYRFVTLQTFEELTASGRMLESANVFGTMYGTSTDEIDRIHRDDRTAILEIDVQGWEQAKPKLPEACPIFILPPSIEELWQRLEKRGTESLEVRWRRLTTAKQEILKGELYEYFIVNDQFDKAFESLEGAVIKEEFEGLGRDRGLRLCRDLLEEFEKAEWIQKLSSQMADGNRE